MNIVLWIISVVLAAIFGAAGLMKITQPRAKLAESGMGWVDDFSPNAVKAIGAVEVLGALGLFLPAAVNVAPILVALAATGLALVMIGAAIVHARRKEYPMIVINLVLLVLAAVVMWGRFGSYSF